MNSSDKPLVWLRGEIKTPPFSQKARLEVGVLLRRLQRGEVLSMPHSRPMPSIGAGCHELRINDLNGAWRVIYRIDEDAILIVEIFPKRTNQTPQQVAETCKQRLKRYSADSTG